MPVLKIKQNGEWVNIAGGGAAEIEDVITLDLEGAVSGEASGINADTLGGKAASEYATKDEIPDVSAFQTAEQVSSLINEALGVIENGSY